MSFFDQLNAVVARHDEITALMASGELSPDRYTEAAKEFANLQPIVALTLELRAAKKEAEDLRELIDGSAADAEMRDLAAEERPLLQERIVGLEKELRTLLLPADEADGKSAILEIRAGTGGGEAALFAARLMRMYMRYAESRGWRQEILSLSETDLDGVREAVLSIKGAGVFARLKFESGVHRVQRVPVTESGGRTHTSAATVAVLPEAEDVEVAIDDADLRIDTYRSSGPGGQHVNKTDSAVRITHLPTGVVVQCQEEKSQINNRARAMAVLRARLYDRERTRRQEERASERKGQVGSGDRSERIRTYNFPQGRVTDHRIGLTLHKIEAVLDGAGLDEVVEALIAEDRAVRLAEAG